MKQNSLLQNYLFLVKTYLEAAGDEVELPAAEVLATCREDNRLFSVFASLPIVKVIKTAPTLFLDLSNSVRCLSMFQTLPLLRCKLLEFCLSNSARFIVLEPRYRSFLKRYFMYTFISISELLLTCS